MKKNRPILTSFTALCLISGVLSAGAVENSGISASPKLQNGHGNPLLDFHFTADPTAVEHDGRLYVYATNDHQQYEEVGKMGKNSYEKIKSLVMMSTDDMANWTYHGVIDVHAIAPWIMASWAPSIVKRVEDDGQTHFYLYFSNSGYGTGVLTATSPVGPWSSPLGRSLVDADSPGLGECKVPFDPGAVIDDDGNGWLSIGAGKSVIMRLGKDMTSIDGEMVTLPAPHHFEANELNYINGTYVYTYNTDWQDHSDWPYEGDIPTECSMCYMTSKTPLDASSWAYGRNYLKNPRGYGFNASNNHTHLHKYKDRWYIFYHTTELQKSFNTEGGFRNVCVDEINVDELGVSIYMAEQTLAGPRQIRPMDAFSLQQAETTAATHGMSFVPAPDGVAGNMVATPVAGEGFTVVRGVSFGKVPAQCQVTAAGQGTIEVRSGAPDGALIASFDVNSDAPVLLSAAAGNITAGTEGELFFLLNGRNLMFDNWKFK